ncbi:MAG: serine/threonine-protein kinase, partial [Polyangiaceae bacterium]
MPLEAGHVIDGKYRLVRVIGTGGMGSVYEGENILIRRRVAIKVLHRSPGDDGEAVRRFEREAQAAGEIGNDHILDVLDIGSLPDGDRYLVMEFLDGETLAQRIKRFGQMKAEQIAPIAQQFLTALVAAHGAGIIHRDLKPENIFILRSKAGRADYVKLIDFGISKFSRPFEDGGRRMTRADAVLGTPCYMSPEQARGTADTDVRSDIYSCGVILYEAVTGRLPFEGQSFNDLMFKIALSDAPSPRSLVPTLDPEFAAFIERAIARDPASRFPSAQDFVGAIETWMAKSGVTTSLAPATPQSPPSVTPREIA